MTALRLPLGHAAAVLALVAGDAASAAAPPAYPPYPAVRSLPAVADWARRYSDLPLSSIVGVATDSVFAVERSSEPAATPGAIRATIRQEAVTPDFAKRLGGRSAAMTVDIDCDGHRVFQRAVSLYVGSNRQGPSRQLGAAKDWQPIPAGTYMDRVRMAVCDPNWRPVYGDTAGIAAPSAPGRSVPQTVAPAPVPPPRPAPPSGAIGRAELGRFDSADAALAAWRAASPASPAAPNARLRIELDVRGGRTLYRALVEGFTSRAEADAFCRAVSGCTLVE